ncbi:class I SAM-dependent methyltransferase [Streptomyces sp. ISL-98]|nr:class I SAM-dependent methyltransferase [Streptomyces sp. ISL-98]
MGGELVQRGFSTLDGVDLSQGMLNIARSKGIYRQLEIADITRPLPFDPGSYGAVVCVGTFTAGHVGPEGIDPLVGVARKGGYVVMTVLTQIWEKMGFSTHIDQLQRRGTVRVVDEQVDRTYHTKEHVTCRVVVLQVV